MATLLEHCQERGLLKARGKQRTASTPVLAVLRTRNRMAWVGETGRAARNRLATVVPDWLQARAPRDWEERDAERRENVRFPNEKSKQEVLAEQIGQDGWSLFPWIWGEENRPWLRELPAVEVLRRVWLQQFWLPDEPIPWRSHDTIPPASPLMSSPSDPEARMSSPRYAQRVRRNINVTAGGGDASNQES